MDKRTVNRVGRSSVYEMTKEALASADWLTKADHGTIRVLLQVATVLDDPDFPIVDGRFDNVSQSTYLKYCQELGLTVAARAVKEEKRDAKESKLEQLQKGAKALRVVS